MVHISTVLLLPRPHLTQASVTTKVYSDGKGREDEGGGRVLSKQTLQLKVCGQIIAPLSVAHLHSNARSLVSALRELIDL